MESSETKAIIDAMQSSGPIPLAQVKSWMQSSDLEVLGAVAHLITYCPPCDRIEPPLAEDEMESFLLPLYKRCLKEDPQGEYALSRYETAASIVDWFKAVPDTEDVKDQIYLKRMKEWMERVYIESDSSIRDAITCGALEHILEEPGWREFFRDWRKHPILRESYEHAMEWAEWHDSQAQEL